MLMMMLEARSELKDRRRSAAKKYVKHLVKCPVDMRKAPKILIIMSLTMSTAFNSHHIISCLSVSFFESRRVGWFVGSAIITFIVAPKKKQKPPASYLFCYFIPLFARRTFAKCI